MLQQTDKQKLRDILAIALQALEEDYTIVHRALCDHNTAIATNDVPTFAARVRQEIERLTVQS